MDYSLTEDQTRFRDEVRAFIDEYKTPELLDELDGSEEGYDSHGPEAKRFRAALNDAGYSTMAWPEEYGGQGRGGFYTFLLVDELQYHGLPYDSMSITSIGSTIMRFGSEEQKREWLPKVQSGEMNFALGYTEPNAGTDLASLQTRAVRDGDEYVINGQKIYTSTAHSSTHVWLAVRTNPDAPKHRGISTFVVDLKTPGITVRPLTTMGGGRTNETFWEDVRIPASTLVGELDRGWYQASNALDLERVVLGARTGGMRRQYQDFVDYLGQHRPELRDDPYVRQRLAKIKMDIEVARALSLTCAALVDNDITPTMEGSMSKVWSAESGEQMTSSFIDMVGQFGGLDREDELSPLEGAIERSWLSSPVGRFGGGTNDVQRRIIATRGLGLPRG